MRRHYFADCPHNHSPVMPLWHLYMTKAYKQAVHAIKQIDKLKLASEDQLMLNLLEVAVQMARGRVTYNDAKARLAYLTLEVLELGDDELSAQLAMRRAVFAVKHADHALTAQIIGSAFGDGSNERPLVIDAYWRLAQAARGYYTQGEKAAIPLYVTVMGRLKGAGQPCLREMAARRLAFCNSLQGDIPTAHMMLGEVDLTASLAPAAGEIAFSDLLTVPLQWLD